MDDFVRLVLQSWNGHSFDRPEFVVEILGTLAVRSFASNIQICTKIVIQIHLSCPFCQHQIVDDL